MRKIVGAADALGLAGFAALIHGAGLIWTPLAWIVAGLGMCGLAWALGRSESTPTPEDTP